jgi:hypothetical protein
MTGEDRRAAREAWPVGRRWEEKEMEVSTHYQSKPDAPAKRLTSERVRPYVMRLRDEFNNQFEKLARTSIRVGRKPRAAFHVCGLIGFALACALVSTLAISLGLELWVMAALIAAAAATFFALAMLTKIVTGRENIIYYYHEIAVIVVAALLLRALGREALPYLDLTILGIGIFLVCGRVGCLMVGCCHGRPCDWGVCYKQEHADAGFTECFVGVRLFPVQAVESLWALCIVIAGVVQLLGGSRAGDVLAWYFVAYGLGRFLFEFMRGDYARPYILGYSESQWISVTLVLLVVWQEAAGILPFHPWHLGAMAAMALWMATVTLIRRFRKTDTFGLLHPRHIKELAEAVRLSSQLTAKSIPGNGWTVFAKPEMTIEITFTSQGVQVSGGSLEGASSDVIFYTLSHCNGAMTEEAATALARLILQLSQASGKSKLFRGNTNVFHLLIYPPDGGPSVERNLEPLLT